MNNKIRTIQIELSTFCNADCIFCPHSKMTRPQGIMSDDLFYKIIKEGKEMGVKRFVPFLNGEPFIHSKIFDWLDYLEKEGLEVSIFTNAGLLDKQATDRLVKYKNINYVNCSLNANTAKTYKKIIRSNVEFETVVENIEYLIKKAPFKVVVGMTKIKENIDESKDFLKRWGRRGKVAKFQNWGGDQHDEIEKGGTKVPCHYLSSLNILWDGRVCLCCYDFDGKFIFGDINTQSLKEVWDKMEVIRNQHQNLDFKGLPCQNCNVNCLK